MRADYIFNLEEENRKISKENKRLVNILAKIFQKYPKETKKYYFFEKLKEEEDINV